MSFAIKAWFCIAVAMIAAAIADPLLESASDAGWFGAGSFTDHSTWDVVPALLAGLVFVALHFCIRIRNMLVDSEQPRSNWLQLASNTLGSRVASLLPVIFTLQILGLFLMETGEQISTYGHVLGGTIWLGGPIVVSLAVHAVCCVVVTFLVACILQAFADATLQLVRLVRTLATLRVRDLRPTHLDRPCYVAQFRFLRVLCSIGERAPPIATA